MPLTSTFKIALYKETHYEIEVEASSYKDAVNQAKRLVEYEIPIHDGEYIIISDLECLDPHWDEESGEEL